MPIPVQTTEELLLELNTAEYAMHKAYADVAGAPRFGVSNADAKTIVSKAEARFNAARDAYEASLQKSGR